MKFECGSVTLLKAKTAVSTMNVTRRGVLLGSQINESTAEIFSTIIWRLLLFKLVSRAHIESSHSLSCYLPLFRSLLFLSNPLRFQRKR